MDIRVYRQSRQLDEAAAAMIAALLRAKPQATLGLATGGTPIGIYRELVRLHRRGEVSFRTATTFNLDEYVGLGRDHPQSYYRFMQEHLFRHIDLPAARIHIPDGLAPDLQAECARYDRLLAQAGPLDLQLLGIGLNGHIGFNEPAAALEHGTHVARLRESTRSANARFFASPDDVPREAVSMGIGAILSAAKVMLVATGASKADIVRRALFGPVTPECPASLLQAHPGLIVMLDEEAAAMLQDAGTAAVLRETE